MRHYCYYYFINGLEVVNVYLIRLLLHIDYDGADEEGTKTKDERGGESEDVCAIRHDPLIASRMDAEMFNGSDDVLR